MKFGRFGQLLSFLPPLMGSGRGGRNRAAAIGQMLIFMLVPTWVWVAGAIVFVVGAILAVVIVAADSSTSAQAADLRYQCDSAVGPDPSVTETAVPAAETAAPTDTPTANPFAELTIAPDDTGVDQWERACLTQMRTAPYQSPPLGVAETGPAVLCARELALGQVGKRSSGNDAAWSAAVISQASSASASGRCDAATNASATGGGTSTSASQVGAQVDSCPQTSTTSPASVVLPSTLVVQGVCGQRVAPAAVSAGDLVFWNYRNFVPTSVGIALGPNEIVATDPATGQMVRRSMPTGSDVRAKRVLRGGS